MNLTTYTVFPWNPMQWTFCDLVEFLIRRFFSKKSYILIVCTKPTENTIKGNKWVLTVVLPHCFFGSFCNPFQWNSVLWPGALGNNHYLYLWWLCHLPKWAGIVGGGGEYGYGNSIIIYAHNRIYNNSTKELIIGRGAVPGRRSSSRGWALDMLKAHGCSASSLGLNCQQWLSLA